MAVGVPLPAAGRVQDNATAVHDEVGEVDEVARSDDDAHLLLRLAHERLLLRLAELEFAAVQMPVARVAAQQGGARATAFGRGSRTGRASGAQATASRRAASAAPPKW